MSRELRELRCEIVQMERRLRRAVETGHYRREQRLKAGLSALQTQWSNLLTYYPPEQKEVSSR